MTDQQKDILRQKAKEANRAFVIKAVEDFIAFNPETDTLIMADYKRMYEPIRDYLHLTSKNTDKFFRDYISKQPDVALEDTAPAKFAEKYGTPVSSTNERGNTYNTTLLRELLWFNTDIKKLVKKDGHLFNKHEQAYVDYINQPDELAELNKLVADKLKKIKGCIGKKETKEVKEVKELARIKNMLNPKIQVAIIKVSEHWRIKIKESKLRFYTRITDQYKIVRENSANKSLYVIYSEELEQANDLFPFVDRKANDLYPDYKNIIEEKAERESQLEIAKFRSKMYYKLADMFPNDDNFDEIHVFEDRNQYDNELHFVFKNGVSFNIKNLLKTNYSKFGNPFHQFPSTFHDLNLPDGTTVSAPSENEIKLLLQKTNFITSKGVTINLDFEKIQKINKLANYYLLMPQMAFGYYFYTAGLLVISYNRNKEHNSNYKLAVNIGLVLKTLGENDISKEKISLVNDAYQNGLFEKFDYDNVKNILQSEDAIFVFDQDSFIIVDKMAQGGNIELKKGIETEKEHQATFDKLAAGKITPKQAIKETAQEHLSENPKYYSELEKIEKMADGGNFNNLEEITKKNIYYVIQGKNKVGNGSIIQTTSDYIRNSISPKGAYKKEKNRKKIESEILITYISENNLLLNEKDFGDIYDNGKEHDVYLSGDYVIKINNLKYYTSYIDYFNSILLHSYFFSDTEYEFLGFVKRKNIFNPVVKQRFIEETEITDFNKVKDLLIQNGFEKIKKPFSENDYINKSLGLTLEDLHDENVFTENGVLFFIDTVFYINHNLYKEQFADGENFENSKNEIQYNVSEIGENIKKATIKTTPSNFSDNQSTNTMADGGNFASAPKEVSDHWLEVTGMSFFDDILKNPEYYKSRKGYTAEIVYMSPIDYLNKTMQAHHIGYNEMMAHIQPELVDQYSIKMKQGIKFDMPVLDYAKYFNQEGRHRALAAQKAGLTIIPVLIATKEKDFYKEGGNLIMPDNLSENQFEKIKKIYGEYLLAKKEKETQLQSAIKARNKAVNETNNRCGLFGDTKTDTRQGDMFPETFECNATTISNAIKPYENKILFIETELDNIRRYYQDKISVVTKQVEMQFMAKGGNIETAEQKKNNELSEKACQAILKYADKIYDYIIIAFSGGKDSLACLLYLLKLGVPKEKIELWHHNIDGKEGSTMMDWPVTEDYCRKIAQAFGVKFFESWKEGGFERELLKENQRTAPTHFQYETDDNIIECGVAGGLTGKIDTRLKFPQVTPNLNQRWCSVYLKIDVCTMAINNQPRFRNKKTLIITGERAGESASRANYKMFEPDRSDRRNGKDVKRHVDHMRPVHKWSESQVWDIIKEFKVNPHPAYRLGWSRLSCIACIFGSKNQWASLYKLNPSQAEKIMSYEERFGVTIKRDISIRELIKKGTPYDMQADVATQGLSKEFYEPVFVESWELPLGAFGETINM